MSEHDQAITARAVVGFCVGAAVVLIGVPTYEMWDRRKDTP